MRILIRTDANTQIGAGHLMRCLALADGLHAIGAECTFLCRAVGLGSLAERIAAGGHTLLALPEAADPACDTKRPTHTSWLPGGWYSDAIACRSLLAGRPTADWLVVDHYALDRRWETTMREATSRIMVIDDLADRGHDCDLLLDQSLIDGMQERYNGLISEHCVRLLGPRHALLRQEFVRQTEIGNRIAVEVPRLLIMFGGADSQNLTLRAVERLIAIAWAGDVDVVAGPLYGQLQQLKAAVSRLEKGHLHTSPNNIAALMRGAGLALGSPGVSSWERCACALPSIAIAQADNQEEIGRALGEEGAHFYLGRAESLTDDALNAALSTWLENAAARKAMARAAAAICDGDGLRRVVSWLMSSQLQIRRAKADDAVMLFKWRNDERTRQYFRNPAPLAFEEHLSWFEGVLVDDSRLLLIVSRNESPLGCVRFDISHNVAEVSIYLEPSQHGLGLGAGVLQAALDELNAVYPEVTKIRAQVFEANRASAAMFRRCGFMLQSQCFEFRKSAL